MREAAVESHPFGFPLGFARGFGKTGQALFAECAKRMERTQQAREGARRSTPPPCLGLLESRL